MGKRLKGQSKWGYPGKEGAFGPFTEILCIQAVWRDVVGCGPIPSQDKPLFLEILTQNNNTKESVS